jgi:hypothetical protein
LAHRRIVRDPLERQAIERRLFLACVFAVSSVVVLFFVEQFIHAGFETVDGGSVSSHLHDLLAPVTFILAYGAAWIWHAHIGWHERSYKSPDAAHDVALYLLLSFALGFLFFGIQSVIGTATNDVNGNGQGWTDWIDGLSFVLAGGLVWGAASLYDQARQGCRRLRVAFLYITLAFAVGFSLQEGITIGSALLQRVFDSSFDWSFASDQLQYFIPAVAMWVVYWMVVRSQASLVPAVSRGEIAWPRRPAIATYCLIGMVLAASGVMQLAWVGLQALMSSPHYGQWWVTNVSNGICVLAVGAVLWLPAWNLLQRAASQSPKERVTWERRWLLFAITTLSGLGALSAIVAAVFLIISRVLSAGVGGNFVLDEAEALVGLLVSGSVLTYYGRIFLAERRDRVAAPSQLRVTALVGPGCDSIIAGLRRMENVRLEVAGYISQPPVRTTSTDAQLSIPDDLSANPGSISPREPVLSSAPYAASPESLITDSIGSTLERVRSQGAERVWLIVSAEGGTIYSYTRSAQPVPGPAAGDPKRRPLAGTA